MSYIVALTGGIGSGKSTVAYAFSSLGVSLVDSDLIAKQIVETSSIIHSSIVRYFGMSILNLDGSLNRKKIRSQIFNDPNKRAWLDSLLYPKIQKETNRQLCWSKQSPYVLWVVPLLIEKKLEKQADRILVVDVNYDIQIARVLKRDALSYKDLEKILFVQLTRQQRLSYADDIITNNGDFKKIAEKVAFLHQRYLTLAFLSRKT